MCLYVHKRYIIIMVNRIENIGLIIRNERLGKELTQEELGKRVGVGKAQIPKIERAYCKTVAKVLDLLGTSASVILQTAQSIDKKAIAYMLLLSVNLPKLIIFLFVKKIII